MKNRQNIQCEWMAKNNALINIDGQVYPCCYLANSFTLRNIFGHDVKKDFPEEMNYGGKKWKKSEEKNLEKKEHILEEYFDNKKDLNLHENSLEDILNHDWFTKTLPESWDDESKTHKLCKKYCSVKSEHYIKNKSRSRNDESFK